MSPDLSALPDPPELESADVQQLWLEQHANDAAKLAEMVSLAALVDPGLLRAARLALELPVSAEVELRCGPVVSSAGQTGLVLADEVLPELRRRLVLSGMLAAAWELTRVRHPAISPALAMEEMLTYQALVGGAGTSNLAESELNRALVAIVRDQQSQMAAWAARALPRLPESLRALPSARYLANAAELHGYRNAPTVRSPGATPGWMLPPRNSQSLTGGVSLFGSMLELAFPWRTGDQSLPLADDRRVWVTWGNGPEQRTEAVTLPNGSAVALNIFGEEITIEVPGMGRLVLQLAQPQPVERRNVFLALPSEPAASPNQLGFVELLRSRMLDDASLSIIQGPTSEAVSVQADYYIIPSLQNFQSRNNQEELLAQCRAVILLHDAPAVPPSNDDAPSSVVESRALLNLNCRRRIDWEGAIRQVLAIIASPPKPPGIPHDVPPRTKPFYRRVALFEQVRDVLLRSKAGIVNVFGTPGMGRNSAAIDIVNDCAIRRHFTGGIFWPRSRDSWPSDAKHPYLVVLDDPDEDNYSQAYGTGQGNASQGSAVILLTQQMVQGFPDMPWVDANLWSPRDLYQLFLLGLAGREITPPPPPPPPFPPDQTGLSQETVLLAAGNTAQGAANLGLLAGIAARARQDPVSTIKALADIYSVLAENRRIAIFELDLLEPLAACPPSWQLPDASWPEWSRYFPEARRNQISRALDLFQAAFPARTLPEEVAKSLRELALPTHRRILDSYEAECGGDWAILPDDDYVQKHIIYHLVAAGSDALELAENIDWLWRLDSTPEGSRLTSAAKPDPVGLLRAMLDSYPAERVKRMAQARISLAVKGPTRWIQVVGLGSYSLPPHVRGVSQTIGRELARWGYGLLDGGYSGVDYVTAESFCNQLQLAGTDPSKALLHIVGPQSTAAFKLGSVQQVAQSDWNAVAIRQADAIVAIGGEGYTFEHCRVAAAAGKPVFPIPGSGGDAANFYASLSDDQAMMLAPLNLHLASRKNQFEVARKLIELLPPPISWTAPLDERGEVSGTASPVLA